jgi:hypothetical protein
VTRLRLPPHLAALNPGLASPTVTLSVGDGYRSNLERRVAAEWIPAQNFSEWWYEPFTLNLKGGRYTPDFLIRNRLVFTFVEVKGWTQSLRADRRAFKEAANTHTWAEWLWLTWNKREGWKADRMTR